LQPSSNTTISRRQHLLAGVCFASWSPSFFIAPFFKGMCGSRGYVVEGIAVADAAPQDAPILNSTAADTMAIFYPWKQFIHSELQAGRFPLWCTHVGCGHPLAGGEDQVVRPDDDVSLFRATGTRFGADFFLPDFNRLVRHVCVALQPAGPLDRALFGSLAYGLNSSMFQHLEFEHVIGGLVFSAVIGWAMWEAAQRERGSRHIALAGLFWDWRSSTARCKAARLSGCQPRPLR